MWATDDGGLHWARHDSGGYGSSDAALVDSSHGYIVGETGNGEAMILTTETGGRSPLAGAPVTTLAGAVDGRWYNHPLTLTLSATSQAPATGIAWITYTHNGRFDFVTGPSFQVRIPASSTHAHDRVHELVYAATDDLARVGEPRAFTVGIDTRRPYVWAPSSATAARGRVATLRYRVDEIEPCAGTVAVTIKIKNAAGKVVKTLGPAVRVIDMRTQNWRFTVPRTWRAGTYRFYVYGRDAAGNTQAKVASNRLVVK